MNRIRTKDGARNMPQIITVETTGQGFTDITADVAALVRRAPVVNGIVHLFIQHTSASLIVQENADPDVRADLLAFFNKLAPAHGGYAHSAEGPDDMPAHIKSVLTTTSLAAPIRNNELHLGAWQAIYLFEHRRAGHRRQIVATMLAEAG